MKVKRGEIYFADLGQFQGYETGNIRPVLIIQNNSGNAHSHSTIVACITAKKDLTHLLPTHYLLPSHLGVLENSIVMCEQLRTIDISSRLQKKVGKLSAKQMNAVERRLKVSLGLV